MHCLDYPHGWLATLELGISCRLPTCRYPGTYGLDAGVVEPRVLLAHLSRDPIHKHPSIPGPSHPSGCRHDNRSLCIRQGLVIEPCPRVCHRSARGRGRLCALRMQTMGSCPPGCRCRARRPQAPRVGRPGPARPSLGRCVYLKFDAICKTAGIGAACPMRADRRVGSRPGSRCGGKDDRCKSERPARQGQGRERKGRDRRPSLRWMADGT